MIKALDYAYTNHSDDAKKLRQLIFKQLSEGNKLIQHLTAKVASLESKLESKFESHKRKQPSSDSKAPEQEAKRPKVANNPSSILNGNGKRSTPDAESKDPSAKRPKLGSSLSPSS